MYLKKLKFTIFKIRFKLLDILYSTDFDKNQILYGSNIFIKKR